MSLALLDDDLKCHLENLLIKLPKTVIDRAGNIIDVTANKWLLGENSKVLFLNWGKYYIGNTVIEYAFKCYFIQLIKTHMAGSVYTAFHRTVSNLTRKNGWDKLQENLTINEIELILYQILSQYANEGLEAGTVQMSEF